MIELLFLLGFTLHNIEEAIWLPGWSKHAGKYHKEVSADEFRFAVIVITAIGYLITFQYFLFSDVYPFSRYIYSGFILMMVLNVFFPHLIATIVLKRYSPGTVTGLLLNAPIGVYLICSITADKTSFLYTIIAAAVISILVLILISFLLKAGKKIYD